MRRYTDFNILLTQQASQFTAIVTGKGNDGHITGYRCFDRFHNITAIATSGNCEQNITGMTQRTHLFGIDFIMQTVIGDGFYCLEFKPHPQDGVYMSVGYFGKIGEL